MANCKKIQEQLDEIADKIYDKFFFAFDIEVARMNNLFSDEAKDFNSKFLELYSQSIDEKYFWQYCTLNTYEFVYQNRLNEFLNNNPDGNETNFIEKEKIFMFGHKLHWQLREHKFYRFDIEPNKNRTTEIELDFIDSEIRDKINYTQEKKLQFLDQKLNLPKVATELQLKQEPEIFLDYSNNSKVERIVFLHELGILDFLQEKMKKELHYFSPNKLAEIISTFTDIQQRTVQPMLHPIFEKGVNQKNNPLTENNLIKVKNKLKDIGFNSTKTT